MNVKRSTSVPVDKARIDNHTRSYPALDYSFQNVQKLEDIYSYEPRICSAASKLEKEDGHYKSQAINLNHNMLSGPLETLPDFVRKVIFDPNMLTSLDLSFNMFNEIPKCVIQFPSLKFFYFHKNVITDVAEIQKLQPLRKLRYLTLQGNPIEITVPFLRSYVLVFLPELRSLNCTPITKGDRTNSQVWTQINRNQLRKLANKSAKK